MKYIDKLGEHRGVRERVGVRLSTEDILNFEALGGPIQDDGPSIGGASWLQGRSTAARQ